MADDSSISLLLVDIVISRHCPFYAEKTWEFFENFNSLKKEGGHVKMSIYF
jgi:hypothetical protein